MRGFLFALLLSCTTFNATNSYAADRENQFSFGGGLGTLSAAPWAHNKFSSTVNFLGTRGGAWVRYHGATFPNPALELGVDHLDFAGSDFSADTVIASFVWRFLPKHNYHPIFGIGGGIAFTENFYGRVSRQLSVYRFRAGIEYEITPRLDITGYLDHFSIFRNKKTEFDAHALAPMVAVIFYLQDPTPPTPATPAK